MVQLVVYVGVVVVQLLVYVGVVEVLLFCFHCWYCFNDGKFLFTIAIILL